MFREITGPRPLKVDLHGTSSTKSGPKGITGRLYHHSAIHEAREKTPACGSSEHNWTGNGGLELNGGGGLTAAEPDRAVS